MALDFTHLHDQPGSLILFIHDGTERDQDAFESLQKDVSTRTRKQCTVLAAQDEDARKIVDFYKLRGTHFILIIRDDDQLHHVWSDGEHFDASKIAFTADQAG